MPDNEGGRGDGGEDRGGDDDTTAEEYRTVWYSVSRIAPFPLPRSSG